ncbi:hypothetical protein EPUL_003094 [Erysiphe pulchra]|uniref:DDE-1 domain-containing protein n=1 Tax=Erysiphe pulchra TaxID=225359 RepID=A0A2S4PTH8_9PEZI|nr:hypothetical protein EPUL_003094 [Erysiphe pulchra]
MVIVDIITSMRNLDLPVGFPGRGKESNIDKTGPRIGCPLAEKDIVPSSFGELYTRSPEDRTSTTLIEIVNPDGGLIPPFFKVPGEKLMNSWAHKKLDDDSWILTIPKEYIKNEAMKEYLDHFIQYSKSDGHICHRSEEFLLKAEQINIHLQVLPSHEIHALQPLDVYVFRQWKNFQNKSILKALRELDYDYSISPLFRDVSGFRKEALKEKTIKSAFKKSGMLPINYNNVLLSRSCYVGQQGKSNFRKRRHDEIESEQPSQPTEYNIRPETNYEAAMLINEQRELRWPLEDGSSDIEISLGTQYLDPLASPFDSEYEGDDQDQNNLRADVESLVGSVGLPHQKTILFTS